MTIQHTYTTPHLELQIRIKRSPHVIYNHRKSWTMIPHLCSNCEIGTPGHEIVNDKWIIDFYMTWN